MFPQPPAPPSTGTYRHKATAFTLLHGYNRNKDGKGTARGYQNIMGFSGGADQGINARRQSGIEAQSLKCI